MDFKAISSVVAEDFEAVNRFITHHLDTEVPLIREVGEYIVDSGAGYHCKKPRGIDR